MSIGNKKVIKGIFRALTNEMEFQYLKVIFWIRLTLLFSKAMKIFSLSILQNIIKLHRAVFLSQIQTNKKKAPEQELSNSFVIEFLNAVFGSNKDQT